MIDAWRNLDGSYALRFSDRSLFPRQSRPETDPAGRRDSGRFDMERLGGRWVEDPGYWVVPEPVVDQLQAQRVFIVILAGYCCTPPGGAAVWARDVAKRRIFRVRCKACGRSPNFGGFWEIPIIELCGEGEEGRLTLDAAFRGEVEPPWPIA